MQCLFFFTLKLNARNSKKLGACYDDKHDEKSSRHTASDWQHFDADNDSMFFKK
jgi:hypothetical protein